MAGGEPTAASESKAASEKDGNTAAPPKPPFKYAGLNAMKKANWLSLFVHSWCSPMIHYCYRGLLRPADVYALPDDITARVRPAIWARSRRANCILEYSWWLRRREWRELGRRGRSGLCCWCADAAVERERGEREEVNCS